LVFYGDSCPVMQLPLSTVKGSEQKNQQTYQAPESAVHEQSVSYASQPTVPIVAPPEIKVHVMETAKSDPSVSEADAREEEEERKRIAEQMQHLMQQFPNKFSTDATQSNPAQNKNGLYGFVSKLW
jgi:monoamine oxidase